MKAQKQTSLSKLVARFDNELKVISLADMIHVRNTKAQLVNIIQQKLNSRLSVA